MVGFLLLWEFNSSLIDNDINLRILRVEKGVTDLFKMNLDRSEALVLIHDFKTAVGIGCYGVGGSVGQDDPLDGGIIEHFRISIVVPDFSIDC